MRTDLNRRGITLGSDKNTIHVFQENPVLLISRGVAAMWSVEALQQTTVLKEVPKGVRIVCGRRGTILVTHSFSDA
jgi:hypothetical protein